MVLSSPSMRLMLEAQRFPSQPDFLGSAQRFFSPLLQTVETVPEPAHTVLKKSGQEAELCLSALVAYAQFKLDTVVVQLKDTLPFQTRTAT